MAAYGDGGKFRRGEVWYALLSKDRRRIRESLHTRDEAVADKRLAALRRAKDRREYEPPRTRRIRVSELLDDLESSMELRALASRHKAHSALKAVRDELGHVQARDLGSDHLERAQRHWLRDGAAPATVCRRLELLRQAYRLAARRTPPKVAAVPHIPLPKLSNARQGFVTGAESQRLLAAIEDADVRDFVEWFAWTGMRPGEIRQITWPMVDIEARTVNLAPKAAKTRKGRVIALVGPLWDVIQRRLQRRRLGLELVFHRTSKGRDGQPVRDYMKAFRAAAKAAKLPKGLIPYDLRRSALRNMIRAGVDVSVAMKISGHRTRSTFDRYNIVDEQDVRAALTTTTAWVKTGRRAK